MVMKAWLLELGVLGQEINPQAGKRKIRMGGDNLRSPRSGPSLHTHTGQPRLGGYSMGIWGSNSRSPPCLALATHQQGQCDGHEYSTACHASKANEVQGPPSSSLYHEQLWVRRKTCSCVSLGAYLPRGPSIAKYTHQ